MSERGNKYENNINPIIKADYPDPDVIRVGDVYYMISTTMHFMPGGVILRSYDLAHWEIASYLFDTLDDTPQERLERDFCNYAGGMWAGSLRYCDGVFYASFVSHFTKTTYLFTSKDINGPWKKGTIEGYYHDLSLLFDDDGRKYLVYGNREIRLVELNDDLSAPKENGINQVIVTDNTDAGLGYEGSHFYHINGKYYLFLIHWPKAAPGRRTEACFMSDSVTGPYTGGDVFNDDRGYFNMGVAQGGIVDTPTGHWYSIMFQDSGAVGRMPVLVPITFGNDGFPIFGTDGCVPKTVNILTSRPYYRYEPLYTSDDFVPEEENSRKLKIQWQWNHACNNDFWELLPEGGLSVKTGKISANLTQAQNCLTQRMMFPKCEAEVTIDASDLKDGDVAGLCALIGSYAFLGITKETGAYYLIKVVHEPINNYQVGIGGGDFLPGTVVEKIRLKDSVITFCLKANFAGMIDKVDFFYLKDERFVKVGEPHKLEFRLDHFTGARFGLFVYSTKMSKGRAVFRNFVYRYESED